MTRFGPALGVVLGILGLAACGTVVGPGGGLAPSLFILGSVDGITLPTAPTGWPEGMVLEYAELRFPSSRSRPSEGRVTYATWIRSPNQNTVQNEAGFGYEIHGDRVTIDLCPVGAICLIPVQLIGGFEGEELVLTYYWNAEAGPVYRFYPESWRLD